ncbi:hypothetical protein B0H14DRAFT_3427050 [Mycena olivaceomarginata]|nr:hypothetical protein B0H14DRAFT_3427050 [Mycena olivaceomarginata]
MQPVDESDTALSSETMRKLRKRAASQKYHLKHREERNDKKRERMALIRASRVRESAEVRQERQQAARESAKRYRERNREWLADKEKRRRVGIQRAARKAAKKLERAAREATGCAIQSSKPGAALLHRQPLALADADTGIYSSPIVPGLANAGTYSSLIVGGYLPKAPPPYTPASPSRPARRRQQLPATPSRRSQCNTYAVRVGREGEAYTDLGEARVRYRALLQQGKQPGMVVARSLSRALAWIESGSTEDGQALRRQAIVDALRIYRAEQSDLEESGDEVESDNSRATEDLEAELDARAARAEWRDLSE